MNDGVSKARTCRSRRRLAKALEGKPADTVARQQSASPSSRVQPVVNGDLPSPSDKKRRRDAAPEVESLPTKRPRLTRTGAHRRAVANEEAEKIEQTNQQPPRSPPKRRHDTFPEPTVDTQEQASLAKRQIGSDSHNSEHKLRRARLTRENLALFDKMVKKKGTNKASRSAAAESTVESSTTKTTSTTTSGFAIQAYKNGILLPSQSKPPTNLEDIHERHTRSRRTASPTESAFEDYINTVENAVNEATMVFEVGWKLLKGYPKGYTRAFNQAFTGFPKDVGFNNDLSVPQPDFLEGLRMQEYRPFPIDEHVNGAVLYKDDPRSITLPHLAGEWKGRGNDMDEARLQSAYVGAALVYARNQALSYLGKSDPPGHAEITTFTTDGTSLNLYAHYAAHSEDGTEYHQYRVKSINLIDSHQGHKDGRRVLRNEQDHAREQSYAIRDQLKKHWKRRRGDLHPIAEEAPLPVPGSERPGTMNTDEEDEIDYEMIQRPCEPTPPTSSKAERHGKGSSSRSLSSTPANDSGGSNVQKQKAPLSQLPPRRSLRQKER